MIVARWKVHAACVDVDPDVFFPSDTGVDEDVQYDEARPYCAVCPVRGRCLTAGLHESHGMWGGMTPTERKQERNRRRSAARRQRLRAS